MDATAVRLGFKKTIPTTPISRPISRPISQLVVTAEETANTSDVNEENDDESNNEMSTTSAVETSFTRRSLRKQGIGPLEEGIPYYEPARSYKRRISATDDKNPEHHSINSDECCDSEEEEGDKEASPISDTEHNLSTDTTLNTSSVTGKCQSFMVKNLLDLKSPQDSIPPVNFSTPTHSASVNGPVVSNGHSVEPANTSTNSNTSKQKTNPKHGDSHTSIHTNELAETTSSRITDDLPIVNHHQLKRLFHYAVQSTNRTAVSHLEKLHNSLEHAIFRHRMEKNKSILLEVSIYYLLCMSKFSFALGNENNY